AGMLIHPLGPVYRYAGFLSVFALAAAVVIFNVVLEPSSWAARVLSWRPLVFIGKISYALYLWHLPVLWLVTGVLGLQGLEEVGLVTGLSLSMAAASRFWLEQPILALKARFSPNARLAILAANAA